MARTVLFLKFKDIKISVYFFVNFLGKLKHKNLFKYLLQN